MVRAASKERRTISFSLVLFCILLDVPNLLSQLLKVVLVIRVLLLKF